MEHVECDTDLTLVERSVEHNEIVHATYTDALNSDLSGRAEDCVINGSVVEYWGQDEDGTNWRVHLDRAEIDDA